jgi:lysophospholipase L1-like esterase
VRAALRVLALGDSYTIGEGVTPSERWVAQLAARLRARGVACREPEIVARTGWTSGELLQAIAAANPQGRFDLVTLAVGVNDQYRGREVDMFRAEFDVVLSRAVEFAGGDARKVLVLSIPDWGVTPFAHDRDRTAVAAAIDRFNQAIEARVRQVGARFVDVTPLSRRHGDDARFLAADGLHPSGAAYAEWAAAADDTLRASPLRR